VTSLNDILVSLADKDWLKTQEVARVLGLPPRQVTLDIRAGRFPADKIKRDGRWYLVHRDAVIAEVQTKKGI